MAKISDSRIIRYFLPSTANSLPEYLPYMTLSPSLTVIGSSFLPAPTATTTPCCGFSLAESGIMIPDAVFVYASRGSTNTLSANGLMLTFAIFKYIFG